MNPATHSESALNPSKGPALEMLMARYVGYLELRRYSPRTILQRKSYLNQLARFFREIGVSDPQAVTRAILGDFQRWLFYDVSALRGVVRGVVTQNGILLVTKGFFSFLKEEGIIASNPSEALEYGREPDPLPRNILTPQEARKIIEAPDTQTALGYRDRVILEVLYATGIRKAELINLNVEDVNLEEELLRINEGKGGRDRVVPLSRVACSFLESYLKAVRGELLRGNAARRLLISWRARPISPAAVDAVIEKYTRRAGVKKHVTCHLWRHTCATHLLKNNANLRHVQEILGHRSLATTERYLRLTITDLKEAHRKFHPREKDLARESSMG